MASAQLYGISWDSGDLYRISTADASLTRVGATGIVGAGDLAFDPGGTLWSFSTGTSSAAYRINPTDASAFSIGPTMLGFVFEGGLAFDSDGSPIATNEGNASTPHLFTFDTELGIGTEGAVLQGGQHDINGLTYWQNTLIGLDNITNSIVKIDPTTGQVTNLKTFDPNAGDPTIGDIGGLTVYQNQIYFVTSGSSGMVAGSNSLYRLNPANWTPTLIGVIDRAVVGDSGLSGIAGTPVPEPASALILASLMPLALLRRRLRTSR
ncbi:MAG TPA: hypothetical protein VHE55_12380 [Fimbriimonadaceae bacterium]|nr:hypothetical protein [Fimbriimonadaceae bacterium]